MDDSNKTREQLIEELQDLRGRLRQLEESRGGPASHADQAEQSRKTADVPGRRKAEEDLARERNLLRTLIDALPDRIYVKDTDSRFVICNKAVAWDQGKVSPGDRIGKTDSDLYPSDVADAYLRQEQEILRTGKPVINAELPGIPGTGDAPWSLVTKVPWRDASGKIIGIIGANRDITERKQAQEALRESEARYKAIFNYATEGILVADIDTKRFTYANPAMCHMLGYTEDQLKQNERTRYSPESCSKGKSSRILTLWRGEETAARSLPCLRSDGSVFYADISSTSVVLDGKPCNVGFFTDTTRHRQTEEALRQSEQRHRLLVEQIPAVTYTAALDAASTTTYVSPQVTEMLGLGPADYAADPDLWLKLIHPDDRERVLGELALAHDSGLPFTSEYRMIARDGRTIWLHDDARIVKDDKNRPLYLQGVMYDVTDAKQAEEALRQSEEKFRGLAERSFDMVFITDNHGIITYASPASAIIFACSPDEMIGKHFTQFLAPPDIENAVRSFIENLKGENIKVLQLEALRKDGSHAFIELNPSPIFENGAVIGTQGIIRDVTERRKAEQDLRKAHAELESRVHRRTADLAAAVEGLRKEISQRERVEDALRNAEQRFRTIFENSLVGLYRTTPDGRILLANPAIVRMMGYDSFEQLARRNLEKEGIDASTPRRLFKKTIEKDGRILGHEAIWIRRDGSKLFICESAVAIRDEKGNILYYEGTVEDITQRKKAEEKLLDYQQQLRSLASELSLAEERLRRKIATDLHDNISQNLAISKMKLESLTDSAAGPALAKSLAEVTGLLAQTIDVTRSLTFEMSPPVLYELGLEAAVGWLVRQTRQRFGLKIEFKDDAKPKPLDNNVRVVLFQAVRELLVNVVKHAKAHKVTVSIRKVRRHIRLTVQDDGVGFDLGKTAARDATQPGFGLFSIRERLDHLGGSVDVRSRPAQGARVTLIAPLNPDSKSSQGDTR